MLLSRKRFPGLKRETKINLNLAAHQEFVRLPGVGNITASRIIDYRQKHGPFKTIEEVLTATGRGEFWLERIRHRLEI